jgi:hypothetical protein
MTKIRTLIPENARPGKSIIQVINPRTGKAVRVRVPKEAIPGQAIELDIPDEPMPEQPASGGLPPPIKEPMKDGADRMIGTTEPGPENADGMREFYLKSFMNFRVRATSKCTK